MLITQNGETVSQEAFNAVLPSLGKLRELFDPSNPEQIDKFVSAIDFFLWKNKIQVPDDGAEAIVGYALTGEVNFQ
jgi:hypothetical protein